MNRIEDYALIGDMEAGALVSRNGSIDWLCWPRFDSDACFAALLGAAENGYWQLAPSDEDVRISRRYRDGTLILETSFTTGAGRVTVIDFMPVRDGCSALVRLVRGDRGQVEMRCDLSLRFDYGSMPPWVQAQPRQVDYIVGPDRVLLRGDADLHSDRAGTRGCFTVAAGQTIAFVLQYGLSHEAEPAPLDAARALDATEQYWREWSGRFAKPTDWPDAVQRSLITLKALIHRPTGGLVAALTTSLPEKPGGKRNYDYRYSWLRDSTFTLCALLNAGYREEAAAWRDWLLRAVAGVPEKICVAYKVDGARRLDEHEVPWLAGYEGATPVRIGNAAAGQRQLDIYGEVLDSMHLAADDDIERRPWGIEVESELVDYIERIWREPDHGIWELRGRPRDYTYSKVMAWVGIDRWLKRPQRGGADDGVRRDRLTALRAEIHDEICRKAFSTRRNSFVDHYGSNHLDASALLLPLVGFLPAGDPKMRATIEAIERELVEDGLVRRWTAPLWGREEGAFIPCTFWLADCLGMQGRRDEAIGYLERVLAIRNDVGLLSEEWHAPSRRLMGNFPQALSHLGLINTALGLCGPVLQRGGG